MKTIEKEYVISALENKLRVSITYFLEDEYTVIYSFQQKVQEIHCCECSCSHIVDPIRFLGKFYDNVSFIDECLLKETPSITHISISPYQHTSLMTKEELETGTKHLEDVYKSLQRKPVIKHVKKANIYEPHGVSWALTQRMR